MSSAGKGYCGLSSGSRTAAQIWKQIPGRKGQSDEALVGGVPRVAGWCGAAVGVMNGYNPGDNLQ